MARNTKRISTKSKPTQRGEENPKRDLAYWQKAGPEERWAAAWQMVKDRIIQEGGDESDFRLDRSVARIVRRRTRCKKLQRKS